MSGTDKDGDDGKGRQTDWIDDEGTKDKAPQPSPLGAFRSPLDVAAPKAAAPFPLAFDPEGPGAMGDAPYAAVIEEINELMLSALETTEDVLRVDLGKKIDKSSVDVTAQIALHTAALNKLSDTAGRIKELRVFAEKSTEDIERRLEGIAERLEGTVRISAHSSRDLGNQLNHAKEVQQHAKLMQDQALELQRTDWRTMAIGASVSFMLGFSLGYWVLDHSPPWKEAILSSSDPDGLCVEMGFQVVNQSQTENVCAIAYPK